MVTRARPTGQVPASMAPVPPPPLMLHRTKSSLRIECMVKIFTIHSMRKLLFVRCSINGGGGTGAIDAGTCPVGLALVTILIGQCRHTVHQVKIGRASCRERG